MAFSVVPSPDSERTPPQNRSRVLHGPRTTAALLTPAIPMLFRKLNLIAPPFIVWVVRSTGKKLFTASRNFFSRKGNGPIFLGTTRS